MIDPGDKPAPIRGPRRSACARLVGCLSGALSLLGIVLAAPLWSDGGAVICAGRAGGLRITLFAAPAPLIVGPADLSALIQRDDGGAVLDAGVTLKLVGPRERRPITVYPAGAAASNRLLYTFPTDFSSAGIWSIRVTASAQGRTVDVDCRLPVEPAPRGLGAVWWYLAPVPAVLIIFALHQVLAYRQTSHTGRQGV